MISGEEVTKLRAYNHYLNARTFNKGYRKKLGPMYFIAVAVLVRLIGLIRCLSKILKKPEEVDILFLPQCIPDANRFKPIEKQLKKIGLKIITIVQPGPRIKLFKFMYGWVPFRISSDLVAAYGEAMFYLGNYKPKVVVFVQNTGILPILVRRALKDFGVTVNLAHGLTYNNWLFSLFDFDYYFVLGESSIDHAKSNHFRFGSSTLVKSGRFFLDQRFSKIKAGKPGGKIAYFSHFLRPDLEDATLAAHDLLLEFAKRNPDRKILVKLHPLESDDYWKKYSNLKNLRVLPGNADLVELLESISITIVQYSNVCIESAIAGRPVISIDKSGFANNYLILKDFFPMAQNISDLEKKIEEVESNYITNVKQCEKFARYHLEKIEDSQENVTDLLADLVRGKQIAGETLQQNHDWLKPA
jgi:hypothetical protein